MIHFFEQQAHCSALGVAPPARSLYRALLKEEVFSFKKVSFSLFLLAKTGPHLRALITGVSRCNLGPLANPALFYPVYWDRPDGSARRPRSEYPESSSLYSSNDFDTDGHNCCCCSVPLSLE